MTAIHPAPTSPEHPLAPLDAPVLLARVNARIRVLRRELSRDHRTFDAAAAQSERAILRMVAHLLHVERANQRGRTHVFATLDEQRAWLARMELRRCSRAARYCGVPDDATLLRLRAGELAS